MGAIARRILRRSSRAGRPLAVRSSRDGSLESGPDPCLLQQYPVDAHQAADGGADNVGTGSGSRRLLEPLTARPRCPALERRSGSRQIDSCKREACPEAEPGGCLPCSDGPPRHKID
ncbi:hypothetical protein NDU88_001309 [Pleurodeles waltl]|uniref:Uncharacterized protein n=1 Tax=Pleurodeles waltl TaxID=8319 RepID=A0AAV7Q9F8_PLEWA|nr:hypothetical protein NDU88_001309 [Pleurodeles waltl]